MKGLILGGGFTGLGAGIKTGFPIYEATDKCGGICNTYYKDGFQFSNGGPHFLFGKGPGLDLIKNLVKINEYERRAGVYYNKTFPYPFQTVAQQKTEINPSTLKAWCHDNFSNSECNLFFDPFNEKYTAGLYNYVIQNDEFKTPPAGSVGFISTFGDPVEGLEHLVNKLVEKNKVFYNKRAIKIDLIEKRIIFEDGTTEGYDILISTIPLDKLLELCGQENTGLLSSSVLVLNIGADKAINTPDDHWLYVPFCRSAFHRLCFYSNVDMTKAPPGKVGLAVEIAFREYEYKDLDIDFIIDQVTSELKEWGMIGNTITVDPTWVQCAYTWIQRKGDVFQSRNQIDYRRKLLSEHNVISTGRYGKWKFQGMVQSIEDGLNVSIS